MMLAAISGSMMLLSCSASERTDASATATNASPGAIARPMPSDPEAIDLPGLHNVVAYHDSYYSGSVPEGAAGFETLRAMGVRTIISVDGQVPDIQAARAHGMKYVHLPIGYNGFDESRRLELARATRDAMLVGPVFVHCHHGKHRSAGAAAAVAVSLGWGTPQQMIQRMHVSGTSPSYTGLFACTAQATALSMAMLDSIPGEFPSASLPAGLVACMVELNHIDEHLKAIEQAQWKAPADHPDLVPAAEAGRVADLLRLLEHDADIGAKPADFLDMLRENQQHAQTLEDMLVTQPQEIAALSAQFSMLSSSCKACHVKHRN